MTPATTQPPQDVVVHVRGSLDAAGARALQSRLDSLDGRAHVVLDFGAARELEHVALAVLARDLQQRDRPHVVLRGLCEHHLRMLRYFGLDLRFDADGGRPRAQA